MAAPAILSLVLQTPRYALPDDYIQALFVSGRFLGDSSNMLAPYSLALVTVPVALLYRALPMVPWSATLQAALLVVSFAVALRASSRARMPRWLRALVGIVLMLLEVLTMLYFTYTIVAYVACAAGLVLILPEAVFGKPGGVRARDVAGLALIAIGFSLRPESGISCLAIFAPFVVWALVFKRQAPTMLRALAVVACVAASLGVGILAYAVTPGWEGFASYLDNGRQVLDFPAASIEAMQRQLPEFSENDVLMLQSWGFVDSDVFTDESFVRAAGAVDHYGLSNIAESLKAKRSLLVMGLGLGVVAACLGIARSCRLGRGGYVLLAAIGLLCALSLLVLILRARVRFHVMLPLPIVTLFAAIVATGAPAAAEGVGRHARVHVLSEELGARARMGLGVACVLCLACVWAFNRAVVLPFQRLEGSETPANGLAYLNDNPDTLVIAIQTQGSLFGDDAFAFDSWNYPANLLMVGGWESHTAPWDAFLASWGLSRGDTLQSLATCDDVQALVLPETAQLLETYLQEHVNPTVRGEVVETVGHVLSTGEPIQVWRFGTAG